MAPHAGQDSQDHVARLATSVENRPGSIIELKFNLLSFLPNPRECRSVPGESSQHSIKRVLEVQRKS